MSYNSNLNGPGEDLGRILHRNGANGGSFWNSACYLCGVEWSSSVTDESKSCDTSSQLPQVGGQTVVTLGNARLLHDGFYEFRKVRFSLISVFISLHIVNICAKVWQYLEHETTLRPNISFFNCAKSTRQHN